MTDTTDLGDVQVVGQRMRPDGSFPGGGGGGDEDAGGDQEQTEELPDPRDDGMPNPCEDSTLALIWNADAAGRDHLMRF